MQKSCAVITAAGVGYTYMSPDDMNIALQGLDLTVAQGEFLCIIGANGSGKSTFAKLLNALLVPTTGSVTVFDMDTSVEAQTYEIRRRCGMVFQNPDNQLVASVIEDDIAFGPENIGVPREEIRKRVDDAIDAVDMRDYLKKSTNMLSGGQKQRIAIAGVLALLPDIIVFDEPTAMLDSVGRREVMATMERLHHEMGKTVVHITHYMEEAVPADRVVVFSDGRIVMQGTPREVFAHSSELAGCMLTAPIPTQIYDELKDELVPSELPLTADELTEVICRSLQKS